MLVKKARLKTKAPKSTNPMNAGTKSAALFIGKYRGADSGKFSWNVEMSAAVMANSLTEPAAGSIRNTVYKMEIDHACNPVSFPPTKYDMARKAKSLYA